MRMGPKTVMAVDPGSSKCGLAVLRRDDKDELEVLWRGIVPVGTVGATVGKQHGVFDFSMVVIGCGTGSKEAVESVRDELPSIGVLVVDEKDTTMQARERYWEHNPRRGWRKLFPSTMLVPPEPVDDFVAVILAERVLGTG